LITADFGVIHVMLPSGVVGLLKFPSGFQRKLWKARQCVAEFEYVGGAPKRVMHEAVKVKSKTQWRPQEVRDARNMEHLLRKVSGHEQSQPRREAKRVTFITAIGLELLKPVGAHIMPPYALDIGYRCHD
jgi:hypothetical protein